MCIVMAVSSVPPEVSLFWKHSQISSDSDFETPSAVPFLLGPYAEQQNAVNYQMGYGYMNDFGLDDQYQDHIGSE
ncbi:hypothetical protein AB11_5004, partial [Escherichia coli 1-176-05_S1_C1]